MNILLILIINIIVGALVGACFYFGNNKDKKI